MHLDVVLQQPVRNLGQVGGLADAIHANKHHSIGLASGLRLAHLHRSSRSVYRL